MSLDIELHCKVDGVGELVFDANITHNLNKMAEAAGFYKQVWRPEELGIECAKQLIEPLTSLLSKLKASPEYYKSFEPLNGWGKYKNFVPWIESYLDACKKHPNATVTVER